MSSILLWARTSLRHSFASWTASKPTLPSDEPAMAINMTCVARYRSARETTLPLGGDDRFGVGATALELFLKSRVMGGSLFWPNSTALGSARPLNEHKSY